MPKIKFSIPGFHCYYRINMTLLGLMQDHPEWFDPDMEITSTYDCFPGQIWNGGRVIPANKMPLMDVTTVLESYKNYNVGVFFTYTNPFIDSKELFANSYCNEVTAMAESEKNGVIVASPVMSKFIELAYPKMKRVLSTTKDLCKADKINEMCEEYDFVVPSFRMNNRFDEIEKLTHPEKVSFLCNEACSPCPNRLKEYDIIARDNTLMMSPDPDQKAIMENRGKLADIYAVCPKRAFFPDMLQLPTFIKKEDMKGKYADLGVSCFKLSGRRDPVINLMEAYVYYFAKDEYRDVVRNTLLNLTLAMPTRLVGNQAALQAACG